MKTLLIAQDSGDNSYLDAGETKPKTFADVVFKDAGVSFDGETLTVLPSAPQSDDTIALDVQVSVRSYDLATPINILPSVNGLPVHGGAGGVVGVPVSMRLFVKQGQPIKFFVQSTDGSEVTLIANPLFSNLIISQL